MTLSEGFSHFQGLQLMQDVRQSLRVQFEQGPTKEMPMESLGREKARAGGFYVKPRSWLKLALGLSLRIREKTKTQVQLW